MLALVLVAISLGLSNFAAAIGIGVTGTSAQARLRVGIIFGAFETAMPIIGLALGRGLAHHLGPAAHWTGAALLIATGGYGLLQGWRSGKTAQPAQPAPQGVTRLLVTGAALSVDNLAVGFALGTFHVNLAAAIAIIGAVSIALSLTGLELGGRIGARAGQRGEALGGIVLIAVGAAVAAGIL